MDNEDPKLDSEYYLRGIESEMDLTKSKMRKKNVNFEDDQFDLEDWLRKEYCKLACEVCQARMDTNEVTQCSIEPAMLEARRFVLNRLAELLEKKQMIEAEMKNRKIKDRGDCEK
ncbi:Hypothetical protein NTJ_11990 [Nesidiocoris tenuis]|uniref:Uncharacterized protein n=1 Tax=Nesidiocoris tenuis TaxID=355587 RepID=A0ABN7B455_9HEMI|nr:Hypothetical protein NTJ_11990 [Nesidiocoris tenuis]